MEIVCYSEYSHNHIWHLGFQRASLNNGLWFIHLKDYQWFIILHVYHRLFCNICFGNIFCENHEVVNEKKNLFRERNGTHSEVKLFHLVVKWIFQIRSFNIKNCLCSRHKLTAQGSQNQIPLSVKLIQKAKRLSSPRSSEFFDWNVVAWRINRWWSFWVHSLTKWRCWHVVLLVACTLLLMCK